MRTRFLIAILALPLLAAASYPQCYDQIGTTEPIPITSSADDLSDAVHVATAPQAHELLKALGFDPGLTTVLIENHREPSSAVPNARIEKYPLAPDVTKVPANARRYAIFFAPQAQQATAVLALLTRPPGGAWHLADTKLLASFSRDVTYEWIRLRGFSDALVLVHHVNQSHGTGEVSDNTQLYALQVDLPQPKLQLLLDTPDDSVDENGGVNFTVEKQSTFTPLPDGSLEQTQTTLVSGLPSAVERRSWHGALAHAPWRASPFQTVQASR